MQRRAARWVTSRYRQTSCVDSILTDLDWPTLQNRRKKARLELFYKFHKGLITINSRHLPTLSNNRRSSSKNNSCYDIPSSRTQYRQMSFFPRTIPEWNALPEEITEAESLDSSSPGSPVSSNSTNPFPPPPILPPSQSPSCPTPQPPSHHPLFWTKMESEIFGPDVPHTTALIQQNHQKNDVGCINGRRKKKKSLVGGFVENTQVSWMEEEKQPTERCEEGKMLLTKKKKKKKKIKT